MEILRRRIMAKRHLVAMQFRIHSGKDLLIVQWQYMNEYVHFI